MALCGEENIPCFDVPVDFPHEMEILQTFQGGFEDCGDLIFGELVKRERKKTVLLTMQWSSIVYLQLDFIYRFVAQSDDIRHRSSATVLHHNPQICVLEIAAIVLHHIRTVKIQENSNCIVGKCFI